MLKIFIGYDARQPLTFNVLAHSILTRATRPVAITPLVLDTLPLRRTGLTPFTFSRFLVPWLCNYQGEALFLDSDMLCKGDVAELFSLATRPADCEHKAVWTVKRPERFEWPAVMLFDCGHPANRVLSPDYVAKAEKLHFLPWLREDEVGTLPPEWHYLVLYDPPPVVAPKLIHFTGGVPVWPETHGCPFTQEYITEAKAAMGVVPWEQLMGRSVHAARVKAFAAARDRKAGAA